MTQFFFGSHSPCWDGLRLSAARMLTSKHFERSRITKPRGLFFFSRHLLEDHCEVASSCASHNSLSDVLGQTFFCVGSHPGSEREEKALWRTAAYMGTQREDGEGAIVMPREERSPLGGRRGADAAEGVALGRRKGELDESFAALQLTFPFLRHRKDKPCWERKVEAEGLRTNTVSLCNLVLSRQKNEWNPNHHDAFGKT